LETEGNTVSFYTCRSWAQKSLVGFEWVLIMVLFVGTQGLAVTYCCHGEEENKMMAIAQKCALTLSMLPCKSHVCEEFHFLLFKTEPLNSCD